MPPMQPMQSAMPIQPAGAQPTANGSPMLQQVNVLPEQKKERGGLIKIIAIILLSLVAVTFIGLFIWIYVEYDEVRTDVEGQIRTAVAEAEDTLAMKMEKEFLEREKYPFKVFAGPLDYGQLTFEYPKTWSLYISAPADKGGDFNAYFAPIQVVNNEVNALRVTIRNKSFDAVAAEYQKEMEKKKSNLKMESVTFGKNGDIVGNRYTGTIPGTEYDGFIVIFKIRDKTAILQTDSVLFQPDFDKLLNTITFNA